MLVPRASALPYAHSEAEADAGSGVIHIAATLDCTAVGGSITAAWLPINADDATVTAVMNEFLTASENKVDRFAHEDYDMKSMADFLSGKEYTVAVYEAGAQQPGADATYTSKSIGDESYADLGKQATASRYGNQVNPLRQRNRSQQLLPPNDLLRPPVHPPKDGPAPPPKDRPAAPAAKEHPLPPLAASFGRSFGGEVSFYFPANEKVFP